jgi:hypothetical protein
MKNSKENMKAKTETLMGKKRQDMGWRRSDSYTPYREFCVGK